VTAAAAGDSLHAAAATGSWGIVVLHPLHTTVCMDSVGSPCSRCHTCLLLANAAACCCGRRWHSRHMLCTFHLPSQTTWCYVRFQSGLLRARRSSPGARGALTHRTLTPKLRCLQQQTLLMASSPHSRRATQIVIVCAVTITYGFQPGTHAPVSQACVIFT
jgi:hypothetical protein